MSTKETSLSAPSASHCYVVGRPEDGSFTIHINGELRGKYANAETLHVHAAEMMREIARLQEVVKDQRRQIGEKCDECSRVMNWDFDGDGGWDALSSVGDDGSMFQWRITVCDDGAFAVNESDAELTDRKETFDTLRDAKSWCAERDEEFRLACQREDASA